MEERHLSIPLLVPSANMSDGLGLTAHLLGLHCKRVVEVGMRGTDPDIRPARFRKQPLEVLERTDRRLHYRPEVWLSVIR
jgi:hypothetical protein